MLSLLIFVFEKCFTLDTESLIAKTGETVLLTVLNWFLWCVGLLTVGYTWTFDLCFLENFVMRALLVRRKEFGTFCELVLYLT